MDALKTAASAVLALKNNGFDAHLAQTSAEAKELVLSLIHDGASIGVGGSVTLKELGLIDAFRSGKYAFIDVFSAKSPEESMKKHREVFSADYYVTSTNAITLNGELVNVDGNGNRVAAMIFGPERVIIVAGVNKIVNNFSEAKARIRKIAPINVKRLGFDNPCKETGVCENCASKQRICNVTSVIHTGRRHEGRITVIVVSKELGY